MYFLFPLELLSTYALPEPWKPDQRVSSEEQGLASEAS